MKLCHPQSSPAVFSAGLDIREMYQTSPERLQLFWSSLQTLWLKLYGSKMANVALINVTISLLKEVLNIPNRIFL